jgi:hypothetical protein
MQEVVRQVVANVAEDAATEYSGGHVPVKVEDGVRETPERSGKDDEEGRWHDQAVLVHRKVVMNAMKEEMGGDADTVVGKVTNVLLASAQQNPQVQRLTSQDGIRIDAGSTRSSSR